MFRIQFVFVERWFLIEFRTTTRKRRRPPAAKGEGHNWAFTSVYYAGRRRGSERAHVRYTTRVRLPSFSKVCDAERVAAGRPPGKGEAHNEASVQLRPDRCAVPSINETGGETNGPYADVRNAVGFIVKTTGQDGRGPTSIRPAERPVRRRAKRPGGDRWSASPAGFGPLRREKTTARRNRRKSLRTDASPRGRGAVFNFWTMGPKCGARYIVLTDFFGFSSSEIISFTARS